MKDLRGAMHLYFGKVWKLECEWPNLWRLSCIARDESISPFRYMPMMRLDFASEDQTGCRVHHTNNLRILLCLWSGLVSSDIASIPISGQCWTLDSELDAMDQDPKLMDWHQSLLTSGAAACSWAALDFASSSAFFLAMSSMSCRHLHGSTSARHHTTQLEKIGGPGGAIC